MLTRATRLQLLGGEKFEFPKNLCVQNCTIDVSLRLVICVYFRYEMLRTADGSIRGSLKMIASMKKGKGKKKQEDWTWKEQVGLRHNFIKIKNFAVTNGIRILKFFISGIK